MGTKNNPSKFDCYANAKPDEPMFVLLARDRFMPMLVIEWAACRYIDGEHPVVIAEALNCVRDALLWGAPQNKPYRIPGQAIDSIIKRLKVSEVNEADLASGMLGYYLEQVATRKRL